jgi:uncharacterized oligopeptide transporter (OPT) family protein
MSTTSNCSGLIPALGQLTLEENPPDGAYKFSAWQLVIWSMTLAFFGVFFALPLRKQVIEREELRFPSGTATAQVIKALYAFQDTTNVAGSQSPGNFSGRLHMSSHIPCGFRIRASKASMERPFCRQASDVLLPGSLSLARTVPPEVRCFLYLLENPSHIVSKRPFSGRGIFCLPAPSLSSQGYDL